jgi:hypothetical protein
VTEDKSEPAPLTDDDVKAMARGNPTSVTRRIARHSPSGRTGKLTGEKATPAPIGAAEMARIRRARGLPKALRERLGAAGEPDGSDESVASAKRSPTRAPDSGTR